MSDASFRPPLLRAPSGWSSRHDCGELASNASEEPLQSIHVVAKNDYGPERAHAQLMARTRQENAPPTPWNPPLSPYSSYTEKPNPSEEYDASLMRSRQPRALPPRRRIFDDNTFLGLSATPSPIDAKLAIHPIFPLSKRPLRPDAFSGFYDSQPFWLALYFFFNLGLTLYNKGVLVQFPFPYTLTAMHALCGSIGGHFFLSKRAFVPARLNTRDTVALGAFSVLYAINIVVSNLSLYLVTVPFHQVVRAATPIFTIALSTSFFGSQTSNAKIVSLVPIILGVGLATYGDYYFTLWGLLLTLFGTVLAALKTIFTNVLQSSPHSAPSALRHPPPAMLPPRLQMHPLDLLIRMSPLAFIQCVVYAQMSGELDRVWHWSAHEMTLLRACALTANGAIAFGLNVVSFTANKKAGPLSMTVAANVKQVLTILLAVVIFDLTITSTNALGILLTLLGGAWYACVEYSEKATGAAHKVHGP